MPPLIPTIFAAARLLEASHKLLIAGLLIYVLYRDARKELKNGREVHRDS